MAKAMFWIFLAIGIYYLLFPHEFHVKYNLDFGLQHSMHMIIGIVLLIIAFMFRKK